jgi:V/A-type H+-transporting ATPase subunit E
MSDVDDVSGLEIALMERARKLSEEHLVNGRQARDLILVETRQRLRLEEERETVAAKAQGERVYRQRVQAVELDLRARLDRLRWQLANDVLAKLRERLSALVEDEPKYLSVIVSYLRECAQAIERDELIVHCNARDLQRLQRVWAQLAENVAPNKRLTLSQDAVNSIGGVVVVSADQNIRFDNTFEGRMERLADSLQGSIAERLTPQSGEVANG